MPEVILPDGPKAIFAAVEPIFSRYFGAGNYQLGGGTALSALWAHRHSTDIDLFIDTSHFQPVMQEDVTAASLRSELEESTGAKFAEFNNHFITGVCDAGEFTLMTSPRLLHIEPRNQVVGSEVYLEDPAEILAKKIRYRMLENGTLVARDLFDIAAAYEIAPHSLVKALQKTSLEERLDIATELRSLPSQWVSGRKSGRELLLPQYPRWLADDPEQLTIYVAKLFRNGPEPIQAQLDRLGN